MDHKHTHTRLNVLRFALKLLHVKIQFNYYNKLKIIVVTVCQKQKL